LEKQWNINLVNQIRKQAVGDEVGTVCQPVPIGMSETSFGTGEVPAASRYREQHVDCMTRTATECHRLPPTAKSTNQQRVLCAENRVADMTKPAKSCQPVTTSLALSLNRLGNAQRVSGEVVTPRKPCHFVPTPGRVFDWKSSGTLIWENRYRNEAPAMRLAQCANLSHLGNLKTTRLAGAEPRSAC
jgi:hypothetical protein